MRASHIFLLIAFLVSGCARQSENSKSPPVEEVGSPDSGLGTDSATTEELVDPMVTFIQTNDGQSVTTEVLLSTLHLSEFPPPHFGSPNDVWDENVIVQVILEGDQRTQILSYNTKALASEYVDFYKSELSGAKEESGDSSYIVRGKNEFGDDVVMEYILPSDVSEDPLVRITVVE